MPLNFDLGKIVRKRLPGSPGGAAGFPEAAPVSAPVNSLGKRKIAIGALAAANLAVFFLLVKPPGGSASDLEEQLRTLTQQAQLKRIAARRMADLVKKVESARGSQERFIDSYFMERRTASAEILTEIGEAIAAKRGG